MITTLVATLILGTRSTQLPQLELSFAAISFRNLAPTIEKQTGWKVRLNPEVENEIIGIRTAGRPTEEILEKIGEATFTTWIVKNGELKVEIDSETRRNEFQKVEEVFWKGIAEDRIAHLKLVFEKKFIDNEGNVEDYVPSPSEKLLATQIQGVPISELRGLQRDERVVFALNPNRMQKPLRTLDARSLSQAHALFLEYSEEVIGDIGNYRDSFTEFLGEAGISIDAVLAEYAAVRPVKLLLSVSRRDTRLEYELTIVDQLNRSHHVTSTYLYSYENYEYVSTIPKPLKREGDSLLLTPSKEEKEILKLSELDIDDLIHLRLTKSIFEILLNPDVYEPLSYEGGELIHQAARKREVPQIVSFSDDLALSYEYIKDVGELRQNIWEFGYIDEIKEAWWIIRPKKMLASWKLRVDRRDLQDLIEISAGNLTLPVDRIAEFRFHYPLAEKNYFVSARIALFARLNSIDAFYEEFVKIFGGLSASQRENLRKGGRIPLSQVPRGVLSLIEQMTFGADGTVTEIDSQANFVTGELIGSPDDWVIENKSDPTVAFPNGISQGGYLELRRQIGKYMIPKSDDLLLARSFWALTREALFFNSLSTEQRIFDMYGAKPAYGRMCVGEYEDLQLNVILAPGLGHTGRFEDYKAPRDSNTYSVLEPPEAIRNQVSQDYADIERAPYGSAWLRWRREASGNGGRTKRDPPPGASDLPANQG